MLAGENKPFPPLTFASPRLLFDVSLTLMSPKDGEKTHTGDAEPNKSINKRGKADT